MTLNTVQRRKEMRVMPMCRERCEKCATDELWKVTRAWRKQQHDWEKSLISKLISPNLFRFFFSSFILMWNVAKGTFARQHD